MKISKNYILAIATMVGTIVGAGIFALPILVARIGVWPFLFFLIALWALQYFFHKIYAMVVLSTKGMHRIPGYVEIYTGKKYKKIVSAVCLAGGYGTLLAYVILGGVFAREIFAPFFGGSVAIYSLVLFALEAVVVLFGLKMIARAELFLTILLLAVAALISWKCFNNFDLQNISLTDWRLSFLLYGPIFFSLSGNIAIPEVCRLLNKEKNKIKSAIFWGTAIPAVITGLFVISVAAATGQNTTSDTLTGLNQMFDGKIIYFALIFGLVNVFTSFLTSLQAVREIYWWDFKLSPTVSWCLAAAIPLLLFLVGVRNITAVVSLTGAVVGGAIGLIILFLAYAALARPQKEPPFKIKISLPVVGILSVFFLAGLFYELAIFLKVL